MFKKLSLFTLLMLCVPVMAWALGFEWQGDQMLDPAIDNMLYWLTETGSAPYALIPCVLLMLWLMGLVRRHYSWFLVGFVCAFSVIGTQAIKSAVKNVFAEPRPYVVQMTAGQTEEFYQVPRSERATRVENYYRDSAYPLIAAHRANETGYSFPSGHTIFAVSWLLLFAGLTVGNRSRAVLVAQSLVAFWAIMMLVSRLRLGMHFPIDLFVSTLIAWVFHLALFSWGIPFLQKFPLFRLKSATA